MRCVEVVNKRDVRATCGFFLQRVIISHIITHVQSGFHLDRKGKIVQKASCQDQPVLRREKIQVDIAFDFFFFVAVWRDVRGK